MQLIKHHLVLLILLTLLGAFLHFFNLWWGSPFFFHPDERNIAISVAQLSFPTNMNPHFFAYGSLPIYTIFFFGVLGNLFTTCHMTFTHCSVAFEQAIMLSRAISAILATLLIPFLYWTGTLIKDKQTGLLAATLGTVSTGLIQFAHFGTFELWLTFFSLCLFTSCLLYLHNPGVKPLSILALLCGILLSVKVSSLALLPLVVIIVGVTSWKHQVKKWQKIGQSLLHLFLLLLIVSSIYFLTNPFVLWDSQEFRSSMTYESSVALGTLPVFYTGAFTGTIPGVYQLFHVYPFLLNPMVLLAFLGAFIGMSIEMKKRQTSEECLLLAFFLLLFVSQLVFFVKWTRYLVPTLPFIYLLIATFLRSSLVKQRLARALATILIAVSCFYSLAYYLVVLVPPDPRLQAAAWAKRTITPSAPLLSEVYDLGIMPFNSSFPSITLFNFYDLDTHTPEGALPSLQAALQRSDYLILPSERLFATRVAHPTAFPVAAQFYQRLSAGTSRYSLVYQTPCTVLCHLLYLGEPSQIMEQTASIFDRPTVRIYKKI